MTRKRLAAPWFLLAALAFLIGGWLSDSPACWRLFAASGVTALVFIGCTVEQR